MKLIGLLGTALLVGLTQAASGACITNHTDGMLYVDQYSLVTNEDVFAVAPGQRVCQEHTGLFHRYDVGLIPYENVKNTKVFYMSRNSDEFFVEGTCSAQDNCLTKLKFVQSHGTVPPANATDHASR